MRHLLETTKCLDGSNAGYFAPVDIATSNSTTLVIFLEGGGYCNTLDDCADRAESDLGSSAGWPETLEAWGVLADDADSNPGFHDSVGIYVQCTFSDVLASHTEYFP